MQIVVRKLHLFWKVRLKLVLCVGARVSDPDYWTLTGCPTIAILPPPHRQDIYSSFFWMFQITYSSFFLFQNEETIIGLLRALLICVRYQWPLSFPQQCKVSETWKKQSFNTQLRSLNLFCRCHILTDSKISVEPGFEITFPILLHKPIWQSCFRTFQNTYRYSKLFKMIRNPFLSIAAHIVSKYCTP